jgi:hypothetical protein
MASSSDSKPENETGNKIVAKYKKVLDDVLNNGYEPDYKDSLNIASNFLEKVFNTENVPSLAKLKEKRKIKSANISDESVINKITGDSYLVVIKVENVMTFKTSVFNYDSLIHLNADTPDKIMGILEDAKTAEDKTVIYAEDLTYLDEMNGINDDIYIIYIYNNGKEPPHSKKVILCHESTITKIKKATENAGGVVVSTTSSQTPLDRVVENFKDSEYNRKLKKIYHRIGYFLCEMKKYGRRLAIESAYKKPDGVLSYVPRKDSIINFGFSGTDNNYYNGLIKLYQDILIDKSGYSQTENELVYEYTVITQFYCYLRT